MDIKDVKVGDRCWVSYDWPCDEYGQNATVRAVYPNTAPALTKQIGYLNVENTQYAWTPGISVFWRKPEAPPKPRRKVTKDAWVNIYPSGMMLPSATKEADRNMMNNREACIYVTWEVEE